MNKMTASCASSPERTLRLVRSPREAPDRSNDALDGVLLASLGHDLRTRLTVIAGAASNLKESRLSADVRCEQSDLILAEVARLNWLLQNTLEIGRIDSRAKADRQWADPEDVIVAARRLVEHVLAEHPLDVSAQLDSPSIIPVSPGFDGIRNTEAMVEVVGSISTRSVLRAS